MATVTVRQQFDQSADAIWALVGNPMDLSNVLPHAGEVKKVEDTRQIHHPDGKVTVERITAHDDAARSYTYDYLEGPMPLATYTSTITISEAGTGSEALWQAEFTAVGGDAELEQKLHAGIEKMYSGALRHVHSVAGGGAEAAAG